MERNTEFRKQQQEHLEKQGNVLTPTELGWLRRLKNRLGQVFGKEKRQGVPKMEIDIFFSPHATVKDLEGFKERFAHCDIFIPEALEWNMPYLEFCKNISFGNGGLKELTKRREEELGIKFSPRRIKELEIIYNSHKPITIIDLPDSYPDIQSFREDAYGPPFTGSFSEVLHYTGDFMRTWADHNLEREKYWLSQFKPTILQSLQEYPWLKKKERIKILLMLGQIHTTFYHALKNREESVTRSFRNIPATYSFSGETLRRYMFGKKITNELVAKAFLETILFGNPLEASMQVVEEDSDKLDRLQRKIISQFSFEDAKEIFERFKQKILELGRSGANREELIRPIFLYISMWFHNKLKEKGIKIPQSEKELDEFLAKPIAQASGAKI